MRFKLALWIGKLANKIVKTINPRRGTNFCGAIATRIDPNFLGHMHLDAERVIFVTGTNGKSSTTNLLVHLAREQGLKIVSNLEGANLFTGVVTTLVQHADLKGKLNCDYCIFEVDERSLPNICKQLKAKTLLVTNLQKDQVGRNGDPDFIYRKVLTAIDGDTVLYANNEEPRSASLSRYAGTTHFYSVDRHAKSFTKQGFYPTLPCPLTHREISFQYLNLDNVGPFTNVDGSFCSLPAEQVADRVEDIDFEKRSFSYHGMTFNMPYNVPPMLYNYASVLSICQHTLHLDLELCRRSFANFCNIDGRFVHFRYREKDIYFYRFKQENPDTLQSAINFICADQEPSALIFVCLSAIEDFQPYYLNNFYPFDCDFSGLKNSAVEHYVDWGICSEVMQSTEDTIFDAYLHLRRAGIEDSRISLRSIKKVEDYIDTFDQLDQKRIHIVGLLGIYEEIAAYLEKKGEKR